MAILEVIIVVGPENIARDNGSVFPPVLLGVAAVEDVDVPLGVTVPEIRVVRGTQVHLENTSVFTRGH